MSSELYGKTMKRAEMYQSYHAPAFTIVELLIVIVVIAILAAVSIIAYSGIQHRAKASEASSALAQSKKKLQIYKIDNGSYPTTDHLADAGVIPKEVTYQYTSDGTEYCLTGTAGDVAYNVSNTTVISSGVCSGHVAPSGASGSGAIASGDPIQNVTSANCPTQRTMVVDSRDNHTYWVQKLTDGKCWMLTNLAYAGGGADIYGDTKTLKSGTSLTYTAAQYYIPPGANPTTSPTEPSLSTNGTGQYGYLYNWCAAMGVQTGTNACTDTTDPASDSNASICPKNWRLPTGGSGSEFVALNNAVNSGSINSDSGLRSIWLAQRAGEWINTFYNQGSRGDYWSSTLRTNIYAHSLYFVSSSINPSSDGSKYYGFAVRCVAA